MSLTVVKGFISFFKSWPKSKLEENCIFGETETLHALAYL